MKGYLTMGACALVLATAVACGGNDEDGSENGGSGASAGSGGDGSGGNDAGSGGGAGGDDAGSGGGAAGSGGDMGDSCARTCDADDPCFPKSTSCICGDGRTVEYDNCVDGCCSELDLMDTCDVACQ